MPYIVPERRQKFDKHIRALFEELEINKFHPGDINYCFSQIIWGIFFLDSSYNTANELLGILEAVKLEFYRRRVAVLEDSKIKSNGDLQ